MNLTLYHYWRSSSSWRVRLALAYKELSVNYVAINLLANEQNSAEHLARNPSGLVPCLEVQDGAKSVHLNESVAIIEWLEETHSLKPLLPQDPVARAHVRELVQIIASDIQPLQNLRVLDSISPDQAERAAWSRDWIELGFKAYDKLSQRHGGDFSFGDQITMADMFLIPQVYNAGRFNLDLDSFPKIKAAYSRLAKMDFCQSTAPDRFAPPA